MIKINILKEKQVEDILYQYEVTCSAMFGDGDFYKKVTLPLIYADGTEKKDLEELFILFNAMSATDTHDDSKAYEKLDGFEKWFDGGDLWPMDPMSGGEDPATFDGYEVIFYDEWGVAHHVELTIVEDDIVGPPIGCK